MRRFVCAAVGLSLVLAAYGCCVSIRSGSAARPSTEHGEAKLTIGVDEESVKEYGPVSVYINSRFYGHAVDRWDYYLKPGMYSIRLERKGLPTYRENVTLSRNIPVLIVAPSKP